MYVFTTGDGATVRTGRWQVPDLSPDLPSTCTPDCHSRHAYADGSARALGRDREDPAEDEIKRMLVRAALPARRARPRAPAREAARCAARPQGGDECRVGRSRGRL